MRYDDLAGQAQSYPGEAMPNVESTLKELNHPTPIAHEKVEEGVGECVCTESGG
jgi:hypothetical protein